MAVMKAMAAQEADSAAPAPTRQAPTSTERTSMSTPTLHAAIPARWRPYSARDVVVVARPPVDTGWFCTTLLIAQDQAPATVSLPALLDATASGLDDLGDDLQFLGDRYVVEDDVERVSRLVAFDVRGGADRVAQLQCLVAMRRSTSGTAERPVAQFVGTCALDELGRYGPAFVAVVRSIRFLTAGEQGSGPD